MHSNDGFILMLEDDGDDRYITQQTLQELGYHIPIQYISSSDQLFTFLERKDKPILILIDYNAQPENGIEILKRLKEHATNSKIPVVLLGDADQRRFIEDSYRFGACTYVQKPRNMQLTKQKIETFFKYWLEVAAV